MQVSIRDAWGFGIDWSVVNALLGVLVGYGLQELSGRRRRHGEMVRAAKMLLHEVRFAQSQIEAVLANPGAGADLLAPRIEILHTPAFIDALTLFDPDTAFVIEAVCTGYEFSVGAKHVPDVAKFYLCSNLLSEHLAAASRSPWDVRGRIAFGRRKAEMARELDSVFPGRPKGT